MKPDFDEKAIDAVIPEFDQSHEPGVAVGIAIDGVPVYRKGFGLSSSELPVVLTPATRMRIGSTSKHLACFAYLLLCEEGRAALEDPIGKFLPELHQTARRVTVRQLMGNIGGLRDAHDIVWELSGRGVRATSEEILSLYQDIDDVNAAPQTTWIYCNGGFLLLSAAIERITGQGLEDVLRTRIFEPVGMYNSLLRRLDTDFVPNSATLHMTSSPRGFEKWYLGTAIAGEGGVVSTVDDMLRWLACMSTPRVGTAETWALMKEPQRLANGTSTGYGLGLFVGQYRGIETLCHPGGVMGGNAQMLRVPAAHLDIVTIVNRHDFSATSLANKILDRCVVGLQPMPEAAARSNRTGIFRSPATGRVVQLFVKDEQQMASIDGVDMPLEVDRNGRLRPTGTYAYLKESILLDDECEPTSIQFDYYGTPDTLVLLPPQAKHAHIDSLVGRYRSVTTGTEVTIEEKGEVPWLTSVGRFGSVRYSLECLAEGLWRVKPKHPTLRGGIFSLAHDANELQFRNDRVWALTFRRVSSK